MKKTLLKTMLLLCALIAGTGNTWADTTDELLSENFSSITNGNSTSSSGSSTAWSGNSNFSVSTAYQAGGAVRLGSGSKTGSLTSKSLSVKKGKLTVNFDVKGWGTSGEVTVTFNGVTETIAYTTSSWNADFVSKSIEFTINSDVSGSVVLSTTSSYKRAFLDNITITNTYGGGDTPSISADPTTLNSFTYVEGNGPSAAQTISVSGSNLTDDIWLNLGNESDYEISTSQNSGYNWNLSLSPTDGTVSATNVYVRLKSGLAKGTHDGSLLIYTDGGNESIDVNLSGSVTGQAHAVTVATGLTGGTIEANPTSAVEGATISLTANPEDAYTFGSWNVYKTGDQSTTVTVTNNQFTMPDYAVTVTATFNAKPTHTATFSVNGNTTSNTFYEGQTISFPSDPADVNSKKFMGWVTTAIDGTTNTAPTYVNKSTETMGNANVTYYAVFATVSGSVVTDKLTRATTGVTGTSYSDWSGKSITDGSGAVYAGNSAGGNSAIQLRTNNSTSGIVTTSTGDGNVTKVTVSWNSNTDNRILDVYGKSTAYTAASNLYGDSKGSKLGSLYCKYKEDENAEAITTTELTITGNYQFIGLRSYNGAMYLDEIDIEWSDVTISNYCTTVVVTYSVTYDGNGATSGSVPEDATAYSPNATVTVLGNTGSLAKTGYAFGGWNTQADGLGTNYAANATFSITANTTLYAKWNEKTITGLSYTGTPTKTTYSAGESFDPTGLTVTATYNDNSEEDVTASVTWTPDPLTQGTTSVTGTYMEQTVNVSGLTVTAAAGSEANPYTVAQAISNTPSSGTLSDKYIHGIVSAFYSSTITGDATYHRYYISDDGTTSSQLMVFNGKLKENTAFSSDDDLRVGDIVTIHGGLTTYNSTKEVAANNYIVSHKLVAPTFSVAAGEVISGTTVTISDAHTGSTIYYTTNGDDPDTNSSHGTAGTGTASVTINDECTLKAIVVKSDYTTSDVATAAYTISVIPEISLSAYSVEATCAETEGSLTVTCGNIDTEAGVEIIWYADNTASSTTTEPDWIDTEITTTTLNYEIAANTGDARTAYFKVYGLDEGANDVYSDLVTISQAAYVATTTYTLVTSVTPGKTYIIASGTTGAVKAMGYDKGNNRDAVDVEAVEGQSTSTITVEEGSGVYEMVLYGRDANGYYTFYDANRTSNDVAAPGYLYAVGGSNYLKTHSTNDEYGKWTISFGNNDNAIITAPNAKNNNGDARIMRFNNGNTKLFSCYTTGQQDIYLYEKADAAVATTVSKTLNGSGYATFASTSALDFLDADGASYSAWQITGINGSTITFSQIKEHVVAGTGILLKGSASDDINLNILPTGGAALSDNKLVGIASDTYVEANTYYGLSGSTFVKVKASTVPAGKALLPASEIPSGGGVKSFNFVFDDGIATGINTMDNEQLTIDNAVIYDLSGRRVATPSHGLYIINGKKVFFK